jgi:hypothetical protein
MIRAIIKTKTFYAFTERIIPFLTWFILLFPIWFSIFHPAVVSYLILAYLLYFLFKSFKNVYHAAVSYKLLDQTSRVKWDLLLKSSDRNRNIDLRSLHHVIIVTNYKESYQKTARTILAIAKQKYPYKKIHLVLAMESREGLTAEQRFRKLYRQYKSSFASMHATYHTLNENEVAGKASNESFAGKYIANYFRKKHIPFEQVLVTVCDADSLLPDRFTAYLSWKFIHDTNRLYHFYWAPVLLYSNFWKVPVPVRVQAILSSVFRLALLTQKNDLIQVSTYSTNLYLLDKIGYWDTNIIPEDWHIWLQAFFTFGEKVKTMPLFIPINSDAVYSGSWWSTLKSRYEQERRWAWGASDIPYAIIQSIHSSHIPLRAKLHKIWLLSETHLLWPTSFFILTLSAFVPSLVNPIFQRTVMGVLLPRVAASLLTVSTFAILAILYFDYLMRKKIKVKTPAYEIPLLFIQWYFLPIISFALSSLPALEAHTRMLLGKRIEYKVTKKL